MTFSSKLVKYCEQSSRWGLILVFTDLNMIIGFILIVMSQKISTGDIRTYQVNCFLLLHNTWVYYGIIQDECSLYLSLPDFQFSWFLVTVDYGWVLGPFIGGLMIISTHVIHGLLIVTTAINWNIFLVTPSIIYLFVLTPSVYPPYLLSYQHCSLINRLTFTLSWKSIDIVCTL